MSYKLYLDDERQPILSFKLMERRVGSRLAEVYAEGEWVVVRHYAEFVNYIAEHGLPDLVSFDHDLAEPHYGLDLASKEDWVEYYDSERCNKNYFKTGYHCAKWLLEYCESNLLPLPTCMVHSMNPVGVQNIVQLLKL